MKKQSIIFILFFLAAALKMQPLAAQLPDSVKQFLDTSLHIIENNSLHRHTVNWEKLRQEVYIRAASARTYTDILPIYPYIFEQIDDHHGALKYKDKSYGWKGRDPLTINKAVADAVNKYTAVKAVPLGKNTGYIFVPGNNDFGGGKTDSLIKCIAAAVATVHNKAITGWIIDLRANTGGNMYPMIAGLACLIGDGPIGGFITPDKQPDGTWSIRNGEMYVDTIRVSPANYNGYPVKPAIPLVVLISGYTASSGEMTAISTVGRKNSVLIGENSAGYTTVNNGFPFGKNAGLVLAVDYAADRNGTVYPVKLSPAITVTGGDNFEQPALDKKVQASLLWLNKHR